MKDKKLISLIMLTLLLISTLNVLTTPIKAEAQSSESPRWTFIDSTHREVEVLGEDIGKAQGQPFAGWYTNTAVYDPNSKTLIVAWIRVDEYEGKDGLYLMFMQFLDKDDDGKDEAVRKIVKRIAQWRDIVSLDSLTIGGGYVLVTVTETEPDGDQTNVYGAICRITTGEIVWRGVIAGKDDVWEEYSRSCYVGGIGKFLVVWYSSSSKGIIQARWISTNGVLGKVLDIDDTNGLFYGKADQMLCIGGNSKALIVYRKWDDSEGYPDLYFALVSSSGVDFKGKLYDDDGKEESIGIRGAYTNGYFLVPLITGYSSGYYSIRYDIVRESDGYVWHIDFVTGRGECPFAIALDDRFVLAWIDHYKDPDGEPKIANIDLNKFYIHPKYGVTVTGKEGDDLIDKHPLIAHIGSGMLLYVWTSKSNNENGYDIKYALINLNDPESKPKVEKVGVLVSNKGDQIVHGLGVGGADDFIVVYTDNSDGEEDLLAYVMLPGANKVEGIEVVPSEKIKDAVMELIGHAEKRVHVVVAFFQEKEPGGVGTISRAIVESKAEDKCVVMDDDPKNEKVAKFLEENKVNVVQPKGYPEDHIMHEKFLVVDDTVMVLTANFIDEDFGLDDNVAVVIRGSKTVARFYEEEWRQLAHELFSTNKIEDWSFLAYLDIDGKIIPVEGYFSPLRDGDGRKLPSIIAGFIDRAEIVRFTSYIFSMSSWVIDVREAIIKLYERGGKVYGIFDEELNVDTTGRAFYEFIKNKVEALHIDNHEGKMHCKLFITENPEKKEYTIILGSYNPTGSGSTLHDECIIVIRDYGDEPKIAGEFIKFFEWLWNERSVDIGIPYTPPHPVISMVMFKPDNTGNPDYEWIAIYNPTSKDIDLSNYLIGDVAEDGSYEALYQFPKNAVIKSHTTIIIAYKAEKFREVFGFNPDFEIVNTNDNVPDMVNVVGVWNIDDKGDEVLLIRDEDGFLVVVDAVWFGDCEYELKDYINPIDISGLKPGQAIEKKDFSKDCVFISNVFGISSENYQANQRPEEELNVKVLDYHRIKVLVSDPNGDPVTIKYIELSDGTTLTGDEIDVSQLSTGVYKAEAVVEEYNKLARTLREKGNYNKKGEWISQVSYNFLGVASIEGTQIMVYSEGNDITSCTYYTDEYRIHIELSGKSTVHVGIPKGYKVKEVKVNGNPTTQYSFDDETRVLSVDPPDTIDIYLSPPGGAAAAAAVGAALGGYMAKEPIHLLYLASILLLAILILLLRYVFSKSS